ncbi:MAG: hypothetical protein DHS20C18_36580 [Saprospiraceae bacterium]|nr:MAG: hypothetical protein DHS20C18_36580 [Saprospiraceae bacterium]
MSNLQKWREDTPACQEVIHFNNAGAALMPRPVIDVMKAHLELEASAGGYEAAAIAKQSINGFYQSIATLLNTKPENIAYLNNATDAYNRALSSVPFNKGDYLLTTNDDYVSNQIAFFQLVKNQGVQLIRAENLPEGGVDPQSVRELVQRYRPKLVAVTQMPTNSGLIQDVVAIGQICKEFDTLYIVDACQSVGQIPVDVEEIHCDFLSATFRKFLRGPRGAGFLYVSDKALQMGLEPIFLDLHSARWTATNAYQPVADAKRFEIWERPFALLLGSKVAVDYALEVGLSTIESRVVELSDYCRTKLQQIPGLKVLDKGSRLGGIITLHLEGFGPEELHSLIQHEGINTSINWKEYARIDFDQKQVDWALRVSPHYYNTHQEVDSLTGFVESLKFKRKKV